MLDYPWIKACVCPFLLQGCCLYIIIKVIFEPYAMPGWMHKIRTWMCPTTNVLLLMVEGLFLYMWSALFFIASPTFCDGTDLGVWTSEVHLHSVFLSSVSQHHLVRTVKCCCFNFWKGVNCDWRLRYCLNQPLEGAREQHDFLLTGGVCKHLHPILSHPPPNLANTRLWTKAQWPKNLKYKMEFFIARTTEQLAPA